MTSETPLDTVPNEENLPPSEEAASCNLGLLDLIYGTLFQPKTCFRAVAAKECTTGTELLYGTMVVVVTSALTPVVQAIWSQGETGGLLIETPFKLIFGLLIWLFLVATVSGTAYAFQGQTRLKTFLTLSGLSALPWLFSAPIAIAKHNFGDMGHFLALIAILAIWLWSITLFGWAFGATYKVTADRILILLLMPFAFSIITFIWFIDFIANLFQLSL